MPEPARFDLADFRVHVADRAAGKRADEVVRTQLEGTPPGYFALQNIPMLRGRELVATDTAGREMAVVIDSDLARDFWGAVDPIGKRLDVTSKHLVAQCTGSAASCSTNGGMTAVVVGV